MGWRQWTTQAKILAGIAHGGHAFSGPYQASLWLSNRCNLRCIHCYYYSPLVREPNYFDVRAARQGEGTAPDRQTLKARQMLDADTQATTALIDDLVRMGTCGFHFAGSGGPLMHPSAMELMARTKRAGCVCTANTNGTLLDHEKVDALVAMGFDELRVTTMAGTAQTYERTHPGSRPRTFDILKESLLALAERKAATGSARPRLVLVCVVVQQNHEGLLDFARLAHEVKAQCVVVHPVGDADDPDMAPLVLTDAQAEAVRRQLPELAGYLEERGIRHNLARFALIFQRQLDTRALYRLIPCYMGWLWVQVQADGYVLPCCRCSRPLGNVHDAPMPAIWHGAAYNAFRRAAGLINRRGTPVEACGCDNCANNGANLRAYRILHPGSRRLRALERECAFVDGDGE